MLQSRDYTKFFSGKTGVNEFKRFQSVLAFLQPELKMVDSFRFIKSNKKYVLKRVTLMQVPRQKKKLEATNNRDS